MIIHHVYIKDRQSRSSYMVILVFQGVVHLDTIVHQGEENMDTIIHHGVIYLTRSLTTR